MEITEKELIEKYKNISDELLIQIICAITKRVNAELDRKELCYNKKSADI